MINKRSKAGRFRGHKTHGYGSMKKNRGAGHRGGRGNAGSGKRGDAKKPSFLKAKQFPGKHGFKKKGVVKENTPINVGIIEEILPRLEKEMIAVKNKDCYDLDLTKAKFTKLLGAGKVSQKFKIRIAYASAKSIKKIEDAGGSVDSNN